MNRYVPEITVDRDEYIEGHVMMRKWAKEIGLDEGYCEYRVAVAFLWFENRVAILDTRRNALMTKYEALGRKLERLEKKQDVVKEKKQSVDHKITLATAPRVGR